MYLINTHMHVRLVIVESGGARLVSDRRGEVWRPPSWQQKILN